MEVELIPFLSFLLSLFIFLKLVTILKSSNCNYSHIPGPKRLPLIGNLHLFLRTSTPHRLFRDLASEYGPLMHLQLGQVPYLIISSVETAKEVLRTHDVIFSNRPPGLVAEVLTYDYTNVAYAPYGDYWRQLRKICTLELMSVKRVQSFKPIREEENLGFARWIAAREGSPVNLSEKVSQVGYDITTRLAVSTKTKERGKLAPIIRECTRLGSGLNLADLFPSLRNILYVVSGLKFGVDAVYREVRATFEAIIEEHRAAVAGGGGAANGSEDLADVLLRIQREDGQLQLTDGNITAMLMDMFIAGTDTSSVVIEWTMSELMKNPSLLKKAQVEVRKVFDGIGHIEEEKLQQLKYLQMVIGETMRLHPPLPFIVPRMSSERCEINGYEIPAGTRAMINVWALGRDPKQWSEAEKYKTERFAEKAIDYKGNSYDFLPFGSGRRICPGQAFGLAGLEFTLATILYHFDWEIPKGLKVEDLDMDEEFGATVARKRPLLLVPILKRPLPLAN